MKQSNYNFFFPLENNNYLAFNALRNGLAVVDEDTVEKISSHQPGNAPDFDAEMLKELKRGGFFCDKNFDEYGLLKVYRHKNQYSGSELGLTIAPTLGCNLACLYCYENAGAVKGIKKMDDTVIAELVKLVKEYVDSGIKKLSIGWYGGEPTLCLDIIERLSTEFIAICEENDVQYYAFMVTNGTLLNKKNIRRLKEWKVADIQITIDGQKKVHDERRPFKCKSGGSSFDKIMANMKDIAGVLPINLRVNLDVTNKDEGLEFIQELRSLDWFAECIKNRSIVPYYGYVRKYTSSCKCGKDEVLKPGDFWEKDLELKKYFNENMNGYYYYPAFGSGCLATTMHAYVVGPQGDLYKCWNHLGSKESAIGNIFDNSQLLSPLAIDYLTESFENDPECKDCPYLPLCMGGCVDIRVKVKTGDFEFKDCASWKYYLEQSLKDYYVKKVNASREHRETGVEQQAA